MAAYNHTSSTPSTKPPAVKTAIAPPPTAGRLRAFITASICSPSTGMFKMVSLMLMISPASKPPSTTLPPLIFVIAFSSDAWILRRLPKLVKLRHPIHRRSGSHERKTSAEAECNEESSDERKEAHWNHIRHT